jgi:hypothetical protein
MLRVFQASMFIGACIHIFINRLGLSADVRFLDRGARADIREWSVWADFVAKLRFGSVERCGWF